MNGTSAALEARIAAFTPKEYEAWSQERRDYARLLSERLRSTPEGRARYRHNTQEYQQRQALRKLISIGEDLI